MKIGPLSISFNNKKTNSTPRTQIKKKDKNFLVKAVGFIQNYSAARDGFEFPEFDLEEIKIASKSDSYIKTALGKYSNLIFKAGYSLKSDNQKAIDYINTRWKVMSYSTKQSMNLLLEGVSKDIVTFGNCFLLKARVDEEKLGGIKATGRDGKKPIGGYFRIPPETVVIKRDKHGNVLRYKQVTAEEEKEYMPCDVIHFYIDKDANSAFGTPRIQAALEDVKMLRRIEGNILNLIYRFAIPTYQWKIGLPEQGFQASDREIDEAKYELENAPLDGIFITNEKTDIKAIGAEGTALDATGYLHYFEARVFSALEVSTAQMGRDSTKSNADSVETQIHDTVKYMQRMIKEKIENEIINELLLEGGFNPIFKEEDEVKFVFNEISLDTKVKIENHELMKYQSNLISLEEARQAIGKEAEVDEKKLYQNIIMNKSSKEQSKFKTNDAIRLSKAQHEMQKEMQKENIKAQMKIAKETNKLKDDLLVQSDVKDAPDGKGLLGNGKAKTGGTNNAAKNMAMPQNQHGQTSVKIKESLDKSLGFNRKKQDHEKNFNNFYKKYDYMCNIIMRSENSKSYKKKEIQEEFTLLKEMIIKELENQSIDGMNKAYEDYLIKTGKDFKLKDTLEIDYKELISRACKDLDELCKDICNDKNFSIKTFDKYRYRLRFILEYYLPKSFYYSYLSFGKYMGLEKAKILFNENSKDKYKNNDLIDLNKISLNSIPAFHSFCECDVEFII